MPLASFASRLVHRVQTQIRSLVAGSEEDAVNAKQQKRVYPPSSSSGGSGASALVAVNMADGEGKKLTELRVIDLKTELERRGLDKTGNKAALLERLAKVSVESGIPEVGSDDVCAYIIT